MMISHPPSGLSNQRRALFGMGLVVFCSLLPGVAQAEDWLQWAGPRGDFTVASTGLAESWPAGGPNQLWKRGMGDGYSAILCKGDRLFTEYSNANEAAVVCLDAATGMTIWEHRYPFKLWPEMVKSFGSGPNATPLIIGDRIVSISVDGVVRCLDLDSGSLHWQHDLPAEFGRRKRVEEYGYSQSPLPFKNTIIVQVGGDEHAVIALEPETGDTVWKSASGGVSYAPATITTLADQKHFVYFEPEGVVALDPANGWLLWRWKIEFINGNHLTPIVKCDDDHVWVASQFTEGGGRLLKIARKNGGLVANQVWFEGKLRASHYTSIRLGDYIYGSIGDDSPTFLAAFEWRTGRLAWRERGFHKAQCLHADNKLVLLDENGQLAIAKVTPEGIKILASASVTGKVSWTIPTIVGTKLYVRDRKNIMALELGNN